MKTQGFLGHCSDIYVQEKSKLVDRYFERRNFKKFYFKNEEISVIVSFPLAPLLACLLSFNQAN